MSSLEARLAPRLPWAMAALAVFVQIPVWGFTKITSDHGSLLPSLRPWFGWQYALGFLALQLAFCLRYRVRRGPKWILVSWLVVGGVAAFGSLVLTPRLPAGAGLAVCADMSALVLVAGLREGDL
jgi:RsiW-degrading membrane proteinase PrsW (M82 family)